MMTKMMRTRTTSTTRTTRNTKNTDGRSFLNGGTGRPASAPLPFKPKRRLDAA
jgi:hypothetical protein